MAAYHFSWDFPELFELKIQESVKKKPNKIYTRFIFFLSHDLFKESILLFELGFWGREFSRKSTNPPERLGNQSESWENLRAFWETSKKLDVLKNSKTIGVKSKSRKNCGPRQKWEKKYCKIRRILCTVVGRYSGQGS